MAFVRSDGQVALLRGKAGDFVRSMIFEKAGSAKTDTPIEQWPGAVCTLDNCVVTIASEKRSWTVLATRTANQVPAMEMAAACKRVDIVVSDRRLLEQSGGLAFSLNEPRIIGANDDTHHMPWVQARMSAAAVQ